MLERLKFKTSTITVLIPSTLGKSCKPALLNFLSYIKYYLFPKEFKPIKLLSETYVNIEYTLRNVVSTLVSIFY